MPSKRRLAGAHLVEPTMVNLRVSELQEYFDLLSDEPHILTCQSFYDNLGMTAAAKVNENVAKMRDLLMRIGHLALADKLKQHQLEKAAPKKEKISKQAKNVKAMLERSREVMDADYKYSQTFQNLESKGVGMHSVIPIPALYYTHKVSFCMPFPFWDSHKEIREGPDSEARPWFCLVGPIPSVAVGRAPRTADYYGLVNASQNVPLIFVSLIEPKKGFLIWEALSDGTIGSIICSITREFEPVFHYSINSADGEEVHDITCDGDWPENFRFVQTGDPTPSAVIRTDPIYKQIVVEISAHRDVLFYAIACVIIDRLEEFIKQERV